MRWIVQPALVCVVLIAWDPAPARADGTFDRIDRHALAAPNEAERSIPTLAAYLVKSARDDKEKVRAIFRWMTDRIAYNADDFLAGKPVGDCSAEVVLRTRKSVCAGYANLFAALCKESGLEAAVVSGACKGYGYRPGEAVRRNHAWNAVKIGGRWHLLDVTWAAGKVDGRRGFLKGLDEYYFLTPPARLVFSHFPDDSRWQLLAQPVTQAQFRAWPKVAPVLAQSVAPADLRRAMAAAGFRGLPTGFSIIGQPIRFRKVPLTRHLTAGQEYTFEVEAPGCLGLATINNRSWKHLERTDGVFVITVRPERGVLLLSGKFPGKGASYWTVLEYVVE